MPEVDRRAAAQAGVVARRKRAAIKADVVVPELLGQRPPPHGLKRMRLTGILVQLTGDAPALGGCIQTLGVFFAQVCSAHAGEDLGDLPREVAEHGARREVLGRDHLQPELLDHADGSGAEATA